MSKKDIKNALLGSLDDVVQVAEEGMESAIRDGGARLQGEIRARISRMVDTVKETIGGDKRESRGFVGINEDDILTYVPDKRNFSGVGAFLIGLLILVVLPGSAKYLSIIPFFFALIQVVFGYVLHSKVDVPEGSEGVMCQFGQPLKDVKAHRGRNWIFPIQRFVTYLVSKRDQVVDTFNVNFTGDYIAIGFGKQIVFRIEDYGKFVSNTTPSGAMKLLQLYASYISLRMITSVGDARVRFTGRDQLDNVIESLNGYLMEICGIRVIRVLMPRAENDVLDDLEEIRTSLKEIEALQQTKTVRLESAVKAVEQRVRGLKVDSKNAALDFQKAGIGLETKLGQVTSKRSQQILMEARQTLDTKVSEAKSEIAALSANVEKSKSLLASLAGLRSSWDLKLAQLKLSAMQKLIPKKVTVLDVDGIGTGFGFSNGAKIMRTILSNETTT